MNTYTSHAHIYTALPTSLPAYLPTYLHVCYQVSMCIILLEIFTTLQRILSTSYRILTRVQQQKCSIVYFLFQVFWVILLFCQIVLLIDINVVLMLPWWPDVTIVQSDITIVVPRQLLTGSIHDYVFATAPSGYSIWGTENSVDKTDSNFHLDKRLCDCQSDMTSISMTYMLNKVIHMNN